MNNATKTLLATTAALASLVPVSRPGFPTRYRPPVRDWQRKLFPKLFGRDPIEAAKERVHNAEVEFTRAQNLHERILRKAEDVDAATIAFTIRDYRTANKRARKLAAARHALDKARADLVVLTKGAGS